MKPTIYYVYDALCGWCYGFSPVITEFYEKHKDEFNFQVLSGGMVTGSRIGPVSQVAGYISDAYQQVEELTGVEFGEAFLEELLPTNEIFTSEPAAMAMALVRDQKPALQIPFATRLQKAIYYEGMPPADWMTYGQCAAEFGFDAEEFAEKMQHPKLKELVAEEFNVVQHWGIQGFPTMVLQEGEKAYALARGYTKLEDLEAVLEKVVGEL